jgi:hypothetical protein
MNHKPDVKKLSGFLTLFSNNLTYLKPYIFAYHEFFAGGFLKKIGGQYGPF